MSAENYSQFMHQLFPMESLRVFMIKEIISHVMREHKHRKIYVLCGAGSNGKTIFQRFVQKLIPCKIVSELGEDDELFWEAVNYTQNTTIPIFLAINSPKELDVLSSSELWEHAHFIPMDSIFRDKGDIDPEKLIYRSDTDIINKLNSFASYFMAEYC